MTELTRAGERQRERAVGLATRTVARRREVDVCIERAAQQWRLERLGVVDRNVLRMAILELLEGETPPRVALDEAVRLARWFGGPKSPGFVNGVLDRVARDLGRL
jgi:N utilization substance protein B